MPDNYSCVLHPADTTGCAFYRMTTPYLAAQTMLPSGELNVTVARRFIVDPKFFDGVNLVMSQRQVSASQDNYFNNFLTPLSKVRGVWNVYNIDDVLHKDDIPLYNSAWSMYQDDELMGNIKRMMNNADLLVVTTQTLKDYYHERFGVPLMNILIIPNYLPHWWMSGRYDLTKTMSNLNDNKNKPRVGIISSTSHFDVNNTNNGVDDITHIIDFIISTINKYQWVFFGTIPPILKPFADNGKIELRGGCDIFTYPHALSDLKLNVIVAPLQDNVFNRGKSNIKLIEGWAMGVPVIAQNLIPYSPYTDMLFDTGDDLKKQLNTLLSNPQKYRKIVKDNFNIVEHGDVNSPNGWWLEKNIKQWIQLFKVRSKTVSIDLEAYINKNTEQPKLEVIK